VLSFHVAGRFRDAGVRTEPTRVQPTVQPLRYTGGPLDRAAKLRRDDDWVAAAFVGDEARAVLVYNDLNLVAGLTTRGEGPRAAALPLAVVRERLPAETLTWVLLGLDGPVPVFAVEVPNDAPGLAPEITDAGEFVDLRRVGALVPAADAELMAYGRAVLGWHRRHRFCGICGSATESQQAGHVRRCANPHCGADVFPRTDPAVIMLVTHPASGSEPARCLLGRHSRLPPRAYSLIAGFVEPGESLEEAAAREVMEETGVRVAAVSYQASQPWPFPYSMMIGFRATAMSEEILNDGEELEDARWFTAAEVARFGEWEDDTAEHRLPRRDSIARALLDDWVAESARERA
jgi:NAD+ diphosphatase